MPWKPGRAEAGTSMPRRTARHCATAADKSVADHDARHVGLDHCGAVRREVGIAQVPDDYGTVVGGQIGRGRCRARVLRARARIARGEAARERDAEEGRERYWR